MGKEVFGSTLRKTGTYYKLSIFYSTFFYFLVSNNLIKLFMLEGSIFLWVIFHGRRDKLKS